MFDKEHYGGEITEWASFDARRVTKDEDTPGKWTEYRVDLIDGFGIDVGLKELLYEDYLSKLVDELRSHDGCGALIRRFTVPVSIKNRSRTRWLTTAVSERG